MSNPESRSSADVAGTGPTLWTIGHSTRTWEELWALLRAHAIECLADVRRIPQSRRHPQFGRERLAAALAAAGIDYRHLPELGGLRNPGTGADNTGWRDPGFRGFADYMQTAEFEEALAALIAGARTRRTALLCAEAVPARCHRALIADALVTRQAGVQHILGPGAMRPHEITAWARVKGTRITYPPATATLELEQDGDVSE